MHPYDAEDHHVVIISITKPYARKFVPISPVHVCAKHDTDLGAQMIINIFKRHPILRKDVSYHMLPLQKKIRYVLLEISDTSNECSVLAKSSDKKYMQQAYEKQEKRKGYVYIVLDVYFPPDYVFMLGIE